MAPIPYGETIGEVSDLIRSELDTALSDLTVLVSRPEPPSSDGNSGITIFLYEVDLDPSLKNFSPNEGKPPPVWLVLKYLITSFDNGKSDTVQAHKNLGQALQVLQEMNFLQTNRPVLAKNPEPLKVTFDAISPDLISKIMQGPDEKYKFSMGFQVRPVMIPTGEPPSYSLLVGIDYNQAPPEVIGEEQIRIPVIPSMGASISSLEPETFEDEDTVTIHGDSLQLSSLSVRLGQVDIGATAQKPDQLAFKVTGSITSGSTISAGYHTITVVQEIPGGRRRSSNVLIGGLRPSLEGAVPGTMTLDSDGFINGKLEMTGKLLGRKGDDIIIALYKEGEIVKVFDGEVSDTAGPSMFIVQADQAKLTLNIKGKSEDEVLPGSYRIILRVNGLQARISPEVHLGT